MKVASKKKLLDKRLLAYGTAAGALMAVGGAAQAVPVQYDGPWTATVTPNGEPQVLLGFDLDGNVATDIDDGPSEFQPQFILAAIGKEGGNDIPAAGIESFTPQQSEAKHGVMAMFANPDLEDAALLADQVQDPKYGTYSKYFVRRLPASQLIGEEPNVPDNKSAKVQMSFYYGLYGYGWGAGQTGHVGLRFDDPESDGVFFGWANMTVNSATSITLNSYGYETEGLPSHTPIPEPSTLALLAVGAAGVAALRQRRKKSEA